MTVIRLRNSMTGKVEPLAPLDPSNVRMYVCGPTVYDRAHIGNARPVVVFDVLFRLLRHVYGPDHVTYVRNVTDVDDKINSRAAATGRPIRDITEETLGWYHADMGALGVLPPTFEPRATDHIPGMIAMIEGLVAKGHAYVAEGHVLFDVRSFPDYGRLSGRSVDDMIAGARVEVAPYKRDPMDFVLWKTSDISTPGWDSPWGRGRPGWHIECSAMSAELLGQRFDIHGGGLDLLFPHHENEIAQSRCTHGTDSMASIWMHNEMLKVEGKKMSKSLGNFFTVRDLLDKGYPGEVIRFVLLSTHYSKPMDWTERKAEEARGHLKAWFNGTDGIEPSENIPAALISILESDLATPAAFAEMHGMMARGEYRELKAAMTFLGFPLAENLEWFRLHPQGASFSNMPDLGGPNLFPLLLRWQELRNARNFSAADDLKAKIEAAGLKLSVTVAGPEAEPMPGFDRSKLEGLL
jgi:cysteinyl-tRNA synthetase